MKYKKLGRTDVEVSEICLGTMTWGNQNTEAEAHAQIEYALDRGINFIDTAEAYPIPPDARRRGRTEEYIGTWFKKTGKRDSWILASKVAGKGGIARNGRPIDKNSITEAVEESLRRLQTDHIDLYQLHWPNRGHYHFEGGWDFRPETQNHDETIANMRDVLETLDGLVRAGKIRHVGLSNESAWGIMQYLRLAEENGWPRIVSVQNEYSLLRRQYDLDLAELAHHEGIGLLAYSTLAAGAISGKYLDGAMPPGSRGAVSGGIWRHNEFSVPAIHCYINLARDYGLDVCQMAIAFALNRPFMTSVIIGATSMDQLKTDIAAADITLDADILRGIDALNRRFPRTL